MLGLLPGGDQVISKVHHICSKGEADISSEGITSDFVFDVNWSPKAAVLVRGSRKHCAFDFFISEQQKTLLAAWPGSPRALADLVWDVASELERQADKQQVEVRRDEFLKETHARQSAAMEAARVKLTTAWDDTIKQRRVFVLGAVEAQRTT